MSEKQILRARDFWTALVLIATSIFFLWRTSFIPFFDTSSSGVRLGDWYNSAALVPFGLFGSLLILAIVLLVISIRDGGAAQALSAVGLGTNSAELSRLAALAVILFFYIFALVPRVDFVISSALVIVALIQGFHQGRLWRMGVSAAIVALAGLYALIMHFPQSEWGTPHDDDWVTLLAWIGLCALMIVTGEATGFGRRKGWVISVLSVFVPLFLVCAMAFGFRQNVPNRGGLLFSNIEYHYYVTLRPLWRAN